MADNLLHPSAVNQLTKEFALNFREGYDINLGVGYVNDNTIPLDVIGKAYYHIIHHPEKYRNALNYGGGQGSPNLIQSLRNYYKKYEIGNLSADEIDDRILVIGANGATSLLDSISDIFSPGVVVTADPYYYIYTETLENKGYKIASVAEDKEGIIPNKIEQVIQQYGEENISFFYIVTVNNPSTILLSNERRKQVIDIANKLSFKVGRKIPVIFDKAYEDIIHDQSTPKPDSGLKYDKEGIVFEIGTLSKIIAPALRVGYAFCPNEEIANLIIQRTSDIGFSAPLINQEIASWLLDNYIDIQKRQVNEGYREKAGFVKQLIQKYLKNYVSGYSGGKAAFYFYITFKEIETGKNSDFYQFLTRTTADPKVNGEPDIMERLVYIPGEICSNESNAAKQFRISYGFEGKEVFEKAFKLIKSACEYALQKQKSKDHNDTNQA
jgi:2-aminoadipate transaminase